MRQQSPDERCLRERPAFPVDRIAREPGDARSARSIHAHMDAVLEPAIRQTLIIRRRRLQFFFGIQAGDVNHLAVGQAKQPRNLFILRVVDVEILALQGVVAFASCIEPRQVDFRFVLGLPAREGQYVALGPARVVDEGGAGRPVGVVEHGRVQRRQDAVEYVAPTHAVSVNAALRTVCCRVFLNASCPAMSVSAFPGCPATMRAQPHGSSRSISINVAGESQAKSPPGRLCAVPLCSRHSPRLPFLRRRRPGLTRRLSARRTRPPGDPGLAHGRRRPRTRRRHTPRSSNQPPSPERQSHAVAFLTSSSQSVTAILSVPNSRSETSRTAERGPFRNVLHSRDRPSSEATIGG